MGEQDRRRLVLELRQRAREVVPADEIVLAIEEGQLVPEAHEPEGAAVLRQDDVRRLEIAMDDALLVRRFERVRDVVVTAAYG